MIDVTQAVVGFVMMLGFMALGLHVAVAMLDGGALRGGDGLGVGAIGPVTLPDSRRRRRR